MNENSEPDVRAPNDPPDWRAIAAGLAWSQGGQEHTEAEQEALDRYDAAVVWEQQNRPLREDPRGWRGRSVTRTRTHSVPPRYSFTQPICERCWIEQHMEVRPDGGPRLRAPVRVVDANLERCAWCGSPTFVGIYVRADPTTVPYPAVNEEDQ